MSQLLPYRPYPSHCTMFLYHEIKKLIFETHQKNIFMCFQHSKYSVATVDQQVGVTTIHLEQTTKKGISMFHHLGKWLYLCNQPCWGCTSSSAFSSGPLTSGKTLMCWTVPREGQWGCWIFGRVSPVRGSWGSWGCLDWRKGGLGGTLLLSTTPWKEAGARGSVYFPK